MMSKDTDAIEFFTASHGEAVGIAQFRDGALLAHIVAVGATLALLLQRDSGEWAIGSMEIGGLIVVGSAALSLAFSLVILHHDFAICLNAKFIHDRYEASHQNFVRSIYRRNDGLSKVLWMKFPQLRFFGQLLAMLSPAGLVAAYFLKHQSALNKGLPFSFALSVTSALAILALVTALHFSQRRAKARIYALPTPVQASDEETLQR